MLTNECVDNLQIASAMTTRANLSYGIHRIQGIHLFERRCEKIKNVKMMCVKKKSIISVSMMMKQWLSLLVPHL